MALAAAAPSFAADLPRPSYKAPVYVAPFSSLSGFYVGNNGGYAFGKSSWTGTGDFNVNGALVGGTVGYNLQTGVWVFGAEGNFDYSWVKGSTVITCPGGCETRLTWLATARGRIGYAWDRWLPFITGGAAFGSEKATFAGVSESKTQIGWTVGAGVEYAFMGSWSVKGEYLYVDLGKWSCSAATCGVVSDAAHKTHIARAGLSYRF
jgi:outer membrane immunogenic protein